MPNLGSEPKLITLVVPSAVTTFWLPSGLKLTTLREPLANSLINRLTPVGS